MGALTENKYFNTQGYSEVKEFIVENNETVYYGSLVALDLSLGHIQPIKDEAGLEYVGIALEKVSGDGSKTAKVAIQRGMKLATSVSGVTDDKNNGDPVYCTTDNIDDLQVDKPSSNPIEVGRVLRHTGSGQADVMLYGLSDKLSVEGGRLWKADVFSQVADDDADSFTPELNFGIVHVWDHNGNAQGAYFDVANGASASIASMGSTTLANASRGGTDGTDANLNVGIDSSAGTIDIENRTGGARDIYVLYSVGQIL